MIMTTLYALLLQIVLAAAISACLTWLIRPWLRRVALARPNARSSHRVPTPQGGGIAVITACLVVAAGSAFLQQIPIPPTVYLSTILISVVGLADDIRPVPVLPRLLIQAIAVGTTI